MTGQTIVCIASGPSLTIDQVNHVRASGVDCMVVNDNYVMHPDARYIFAADMRWWYRHYNDVPKAMACYTLAGHPEHINKRVHGARDRLIGVSYDAKYGLYDDKVHHGGNSGYMAVQLCRILGYGKIVLLGFDMQHTGGKRHWFGDHDMRYFTKNADKVDDWAVLMDKWCYDAMAEGKVEIVNCTTQTALTIPRKSVIMTEV